MQAASAIMLLALTISNAKTAGLEHYTVVELFGQFVSATEAQSVAFEKKLANKNIAIDGIVHEFSEPGLNGHHFIWMRGRTKEAAGRFMLTPGATGNAPSYKAGQHIRIVCWDSFRSGPHVSSARCRMP